MKKVTSKTPHRLSLTGATDFFPYVEKYGGDGFAATIDKWVTVTISEVGGSYIDIVHPGGKEKVREVEDLEHPIIKNILEKYHSSNGLRIVSESDVPPSSGLGSSGAFTVGFLNALHKFFGRDRTPLELAEEAADIEIRELGAPIGRYDQYLAAFGGMLHLVFNPDHTIEVKRVKLPEATQNDLNRNLVLVFSGITRSASSVSKATADRFKDSDQVFHDMNEFREAGNQARNLLIKGDIPEFLDALNKLSAIKRRCFVSSSNDQIDQFIAIGHKAGALGSKIIGAGGGGFVYFYVPEEKQPEFKKAVTSSGGTVYPFKFVDQGSQIIEAN